ncbi:MAG: 2,3-diphosphoglycerate synthetase, partial [Actinomycetota bacterium]|nr:2,3-diphosphoglycerate synthetase [Actinomycetota bacterium]
MAGGPVIALVDGEHHPGAVRDALDALSAEREVAGVVFCGGEEKVRGGVLEDPERHYGRPVIGAGDPAGAVQRLAATTGACAVVDLADEPVLPPPARMALAALALHLGLRYEAPGMRLDPPRYAPLDFPGPKLAVIGTGKRTGKTAVASALARHAVARGARPIIIAVGRGGPDPPRTIEAGT